MAKSRYLLIKLKLLEMGEVNNALELDDLLIPSQLEIGKEKVHDSNMQSELLLYEERYDIFKRNKKASYRIDSYHKTLQSEAIDLFFKSNNAIKKCENCGAFSPSFRKDGFTKIFQKSLPKRIRNTMKTMKLQLKVS